MVEGLKAGSVDIVIGTHRLLQRDVSFRDLGLVVVDEEHRFGVGHKERLKQMRADVDMLTLTATPIPRTLNMALGGLRDLSLMTTPPAERVAIETFVTEWSDGLVREACLREIRRGGQVYFVHNVVEDIEAFAERLRRLVPEATIRVGHGQMRERDLEQLMLDFYHRRFQVLVCTTIIESGIDVPTANTILIDRADRFGLAQLHQLRGRVGRSHHRAFAYLLAPPVATLPDDARKRLEAIESLEDLGAGFTLATQDLEIRGAGELLGEEQSGQIQEIGLGLYLELLERAVAALREGREPALDAPVARPAAKSTCSCRPCCRRTTSPTCTCACSSTSACRVPPTASGSTISRPSSSIASARCRPRPGPCSSCTDCASAPPASASAASSSAPRAASWSSARITRSRPTASSGSSSGPAAATGSTAPRACGSASRPPMRPRGSPPRTSGRSESNLGG